MKNNSILHSLGHAILVFLYISGIALFMSNGEAIFGGEPKDLWVPIIMLTLFVLSATIVGALVLGRPILLCVEGRKTEALRFFGYTISWLFVGLVIVMIIQPWR